MLSNELCKLFNCSTSTDSLGIFSSFPWEPVLPLTTNIATNTANYPSKGPKHNSQVFFLWRITTFLPQENCLHSHHDFTAPKNCLGYLVTKHLIKTPTGETPQNHPRFKAPFCCVASTPNENVTSKSQKILKNMKFQKKREQTEAFQNIQLDHFSFLQILIHFLDLQPIVLETGEPPFDFACSPVFSSEITEKIWQRTRIVHWTISSHSGEHPAHRKVKFQFGFTLHSIQTLGTV